MYAGPGIRIRYDVTWPCWPEAASFGGPARARMNRPASSTASLASGRKFQKMWKACVGTG